jgi:hypothetical protein
MLSTLCMLHTGFTTDKGGHCTEAIWHMGFSSANLLDAHVGPELAAVVCKVLCPQLRRCATRRIPCVCARVVGKSIVTSLAAHKGCTLRRAVC